MVATPLVEPYIEAGRDVVQALDEAKFDFDAAFWLYRSESASWRLVIASKLVDEVGPLETYREIRDLLPPGSPLSLRDISVVNPTNDVVVLLRKAIRTGPSISNIRFTSSTIDGTFIEDALIYRT